MIVTQQLFMLHIAIYTYTYSSTPNKTHLDFYYTITDYVT